MKNYWKKVKQIAAASVGICLVLFYFSLPRVLFSDSFSTVLVDNKNNLLCASIAPDGQWRFPEGDTVSYKFNVAIVAYEDKRFFLHFGVDPVSIGRAILQNAKSKKIRSGASTITMQVIRLSRKNRDRTFFEKIIEFVLATRLEFRHSKKEILSLYTAHAPFGGNVVGLEAACWRYFGRPANELSWAEAAMLAVLPNNPSLIHLGKNRSLLKVKRDRLLTKLHGLGKLDVMEMNLAIAEPIPESPLPLPRLAPHLLDRAISEGKAQQKTIATIDYALQQQTQNVLRDHIEKLSANKIFNAAALVVDVASGHALAYVGNVESGSEHNEQVDVVRSPRSTGSILKPILYAAMLDEGKMLSKTLQPDIPITIDGFAPKNFSNQFDGAVAANQALIRSLNIPAVEELRDYRYEKFYELLKNTGMTTLNKSADHYGLSIILGGAEGTLWDIAGIYASMARTLNNYFLSPGKNRYVKKDFHPLRYVNAPKFDNSQNESETTSSSWLSAASIYLTFDALKELYRPGEETGWQYFSSSKKIAWKTGTSHGLRDGWAIGVNPDYVVGVWVGNADGEGRPRLTGTETAAPILFDLFALLPGKNWFAAPTPEMEQIPVCAKSGYRATELCEKVDTAWVTKSGLTSGACPFHKKIHLSQNKKWRVHSGCEDPNQMNAVNWFILPPVQAYYYQQYNEYRPLPPFKESCVSNRTLTMIDLIYPKQNAKIFVPRQLVGNAGQTLFEAVHSDPTATIYWHLDGAYIGKTSKKHSMALNPSNGHHEVILVDGQGESISRSFDILSKH